MRHASLRFFDNGELRYYAEHVLALLAPGGSVKAWDTYGKHKPGTLDGWTTDDRDVLIEQARLQLQALNDRYEQIRGRCQLVATTNLALTVIVAALLGRFKHGHVILLIGWSVGLTFLAVGFLGAVAGFAVTSQLGSIDTVLLSETTRDVRGRLARDYPAQVLASANTVNSRLTILRDATWFSVVGAILSLLMWLLLNIV